MIRPALSKIKYGKNGRLSIPAGGNSHRNLFDVKKLTGIPAKGRDSEAENRFRILTALGAIHTLKTGF